MNTKITKTSLIVTILLSFFIMANSSAPPAGRTGAPGEGLCTACHGTNNPLGLDGDLMIQGIPDQVNPGNTYQLEVLLRNPNGLAARGGFQLVVLDENNNNFGSFDNPSQGSRTRNFSGRNYFEHNPSQNFTSANTVSWTVDWTIPEDTESSEMNIYASGIIADGNGANTRDFYVKNELTANVITTNVNDFTLGNITLFPNPATQWLSLGNLRPDATVSFQLIDYMGLLHLEGQYHSGDKIDISLLPIGNYFMILREGTNVELFKFQKVRN